MATTAAVLIPHPTTPRAAVHAILVEVSRPAADVLAFHYRLDGVLAAIRIPPPAPPAIEIGLWERTCFEAFVAVEGDSGYRELNFSPSGTWALHEFHAYRDGEALDDVSLAPAIAVESSPRSLALAATVPLARWSPSYRERPLLLGLAAVVEAVDGARSFWALRHTAGRPDFHDPEARALCVPAPEAA